MTSSEDLVKAAIEARRRAHAPYSRYAVGAAVLDENGQIHVGVNVENAAYPVGQCAEAGAIAQMVVSGGRRIQNIAVAGKSGGAPCTPCGACRQRIREFADSRAQILVCDESGLIETFTLGELLPHGFGPENLK